jgi:dTDP-4-dehydrorhamnose reductase
LRAHDVIAADRATLDLGKPESISAVLDHLAPEFIINPAAYTAVDKAEDERDVAMRVNAEAPGAIARWARARGLPFIHFSTDYVFDGSGAVPWRETDATRPLSVYGSSKLAGENAIRAVGGNSLIIRASWVYAARGVNFLRTILRLAQERKELRIVDDQIGSPTSASAVAGAVAILVSGGQQRFATSVMETKGIVHLAASGETSWYGFANAIIEGLKARGVPLAVERVVAIPSEAYSTRAMRPRNSRLDLTRMRELLGGGLPGWREMLDLELDKVATELSGT